MITPAFKLRHESKFHFYIRCAEPYVVIAAFSFAVVYMVLN